MFGRVFLARLTAAPGDAAERWADTFAWRDGKPRSFVDGAGAFTKADERWQFVASTLCDWPPARNALSWRDVSEAEGLDAMELFQLLSLDFPRRCSL